MEGRTHRSERLGVLGGTFDPPHRAHVELARAARDQFDLDRVLLVVAGDPWQKQGDVVAAAADRLAMAEAAVAGEHRVDVSDIEIRRSGPTYTADTLEELAREGRELFFVVGADVAATLDTWKHTDVVRRLATLVVAARPHEVPRVREVVQALRSERWRCALLEVPAMPVSSTALREGLAGGPPTGGRAGEWITEWVPPGVMRVIEERGLYTRSG